MLFEEILPALREGKKVMLRGWTHPVTLLNGMFVYTDQAQSTMLTVSEIISDAWEIVEDTELEKYKRLAEVVEYSGVYKDCPDIRAALDALKRN